MIRSLVPIALLLCVLTGCTSVPKGKSAIDAVTIRNADKVDEDDTLDKIATAATPKFLYLFRGVLYDYQIYDRFVLQRDLARIERYYQAQGYYDAKARAGRVIQKNNNHVRVEIVVEEGPPVLVKDLQIEWPKDTTVSDAIKLKAYLATKAHLPLDKPFVEDGFSSAQDDVQKAVTDAGFAYAKVTRNANVDIATHTASVTYTVVPDLPAKFGKITIEGLDPDDGGPLVPEIPEDKIRSTLNIFEGQPYSTAEIDSASAALTDLEVFSSVHIVPQLSDPPPADHIVPLKITLVPAKLRSLRLGGGIEFDALKFDVHGVIGWEDHNFLGNLRDLQVTFKPGVVLYPTRFNYLKAPTQPLPEEKLSVNFKQPSFLEARTEGFIRPEFNIYPILVPNYQAASTDANGKAIPPDPVIGYLEPKATVGVDRLFLRKLYITLSYTAQVESPFAYVGPLGAGLSTILLSYPELKASLDFTDNKLHPHAGFYLGNNLQIAGGIFGGSATDLKVQPEARVYIPVGKRITWATRASIGFILPVDWGDYIRHGLTSGTTAAQAGEIKDLEIDLFRGFYSGGPSSNRGYPTRSIGPYTFVPFLNPASANAQFKNGEACIGSVVAAQNGQKVAGPCDTAVGGMSIWEASSELRIIIKGPLSVATFVDGSDVSSQLVNIRPNHPHISVGAGGRYDTPVGPLRVDIGYRVPGLQYPTGDP
ncbi:MAG: BamA/TamA family outer membrane protein, partial [Polyangiaceae bacterium]